MAGGMPRRPPKLGAGVAAGAAPPPLPPLPPPPPPPLLPVPVAVADIGCEGSGVCVGFWLLKIAVAIWGMITGVGASGVRGRVPCKETMGVSAVVRMLTLIDVFVLTGSVGSAGLRFSEWLLDDVCVLSGLLHGVGARAGGRYLGF